MVSVPITTRRSVEVQPLGNQRLRYTAPRNLVGPAIEGFGQSLGKVGEDFDQIEATYDDANRLELQNDLLTNISATRSGFRNLRGKEPAQNLDEAYGALKKRADELLASARSPRARALARRAFDPLLTNVRDFMTAHADEQMFEFRGNQLEAQAGTFAENAVEAHDAPDFPVYLISGQETLGKLQGHFGWSDDELAKKQAGYTSNVHRRVIAKLQARGRIAEAAEWAERHAAEIIDTDETEIWRGLQPALEEAEIDNGLAEVEQILGGREPAEDSSLSSKQPVDEDDPDPLRGIGRITTTPREHQKRGRLAVDIAAPAGTPIYPPMSGKVSGKGFDPKGNGHFIRVRHPNGYETTYLHMRSASPLEVGDEVSAVTVLGGVGSTGRSTGNHLDYSVRDAKGRAVDPLAMRWDEGPLPAYKPERNDKEAMYDAARQVATRRKYSRRQYDALLQRIDAIVRREDDLKAREDEERVRIAMDVVEQLGDDFTRRDQIPNWASLPAETRLSLSARIKANTAPEPVETDMETYWALQQLAATDAKAFAELDVFKYADKLSKGDLRQLIRDQAATIGRDGKVTPQFVARSRLFSVARDAMHQAGIPTRNSAPARSPLALKRRIEFLNDLQKFADGWAVENPGKVPPDAEIQRWAGILLTRPSDDLLPGPFEWKRKARFLFEMPPAEVVKRMTDNNRTMAQQSLRRAGLPVTDENVAEIYLRALRDGAGGR